MKILSVFFISLLLVSVVSAVSSNEEDENELYRESSFRWVFWKFDKWLSSLGDETVGGSTPMGSDFDFVDGHYELKNDILNESQVDEYCDNNGYLKNGTSVNFTSVYLGNNGYFYSGINNDSEDAIVFESVESIDFVLGVDGYFNVRNSNNEFLFYVWEETGIMQAEFGACFGSDESSELCIDENGSLTSFAPMVVNNNITANYFIGDGFQLSNLNESLIDSYCDNNGYYENGDSVNFSDLNVVQNITTPIVTTSGTTDEFQIKPGATGSGVGVSLFEDSGKVTGNNPLLRMRGYASSLGWDQQKYVDISLDTWGRLKFDGNYRFLYLTKGLQIGNLPTASLLIGGYSNQLGTNIAGTVDHPIYSTDFTVAQAPIHVYTEFDRTNSNFAVPSTRYAQIWLHDGTATLTNLLKLYHDGDKGVIKAEAGYLELQNDVNITGELDYDKAYAQTAYHNESSPLVITLTNEDEYYNVTGLHLDYNNSIYMDGQAIIEKTDMYQLTGSISFSGGNSGLYRFNLFVNDVEEPACGAMRTTSTSQLGSLSINCLVELEEGDKVNMRVKDTTSPVQDVSLYTVTLNMVEI